MIRWLRRVLRRHHDERLDDEMAAHLDELTRQHQSRGLRVEDARLAARRDFGAATRVREDYRAQRGWLWLDDLRQDLRYAARALWRNRGVTAITVFTLALGIGAATAIFAVVYSALLKPLPYEGGERLVRLRTVITGPDGQPRRIPVNLTSAERALLGRASRTLDHVVVAFPWMMNWRGRDPRWQGARVSASVFPMLGVRPLLGRVFSADDEQPGINTLILSARAWRESFDGDPNVLGRTVTLESALGPPDPAVYTIVGVMPDGFEYPQARVRFWMPSPAVAASAEAAPPRAPIAARLAEGVSPSAAAAEIMPILRQLARDVPTGNRPNLQVQSYEVVGEQDERVGQVRPALLVISAAVAVLFLLACVNAAGVVMTRTTVRQREIAIRTAIGARRSRLIRLVATESIMLAALASAIGALAGVGGVWLLQWLTGAPYRFDVDIDGRGTYPGLDTVTLDAIVLGFLAVLMALAEALVAVPPLLSYLRATPADVLRGGSGATHGDGVSLARSVGAGGALVVAEVALSVMLLVGGALLVTSFVRLLSVETGYEPAGVLTFQVSVPADRYPGELARDFAERLTGQLDRLDGVRSSAYANQLPMVGLRDTAGGLFRTPDETRRGGPPGSPDARIVSHRYLDTMGISLVAGRGLTADDGPTAEHVLLVNEALARRDFGGASALGQIVYVGNDPKPWRIVGIVADVRQFWLNLPAEPQFFFDARQWSRRGPLFPVGAYYAVRSNGDPTTLQASIERVAKALDPDAVVFNVAPMDALVSATAGWPRLYAVVVGVFAMVGLVLAVLGLYGIVSSGVARRTREIGVRMALGARRADVLGAVLRGALVMTGLGILIGLTGAAMVTKYLQSLLFDVEPFDRSVFAWMSVLFVLVALAASAVPARRATRIDPLVALRTE